VTAFAKEVSYNYAEYTAVEKMQSGVVYAQFGWMVHHRKRRTYWSCRGNWILPQQNRSGRYAISNFWRLGVLLQRQGRRWFLRTETLLRTFQIP
jgi:hypothetical protein